MNLRALVLLLGITACTPSNDRAKYRAPEQTGFSLVSPMLEAHCGSLDCHGQPGRSLRIWSQNGMRLSPDDVSGDGGTRTDERDANYSSVITLEPEILDAVVADGGKNPERLTLVRKARGSEHHKGGSALIPGGPADRCLISWLAGVPSASDCNDPDSTSVKFPAWP